MSSPDTPDKDDEDVTPSPQVENAGAGGGRKNKTTVGLGDGIGDEDGGWYKPRELPSGAGKNEPVLHSLLKDAAIDALIESSSRDYSDISRRLTKWFPQFDDAKEGLADALACMVISAYTVAQFVPEAHVFEELRFTCPYFSDQQLLRIMELASRTRPIVR